MTRLEYERRERGWSQRRLLAEAGLGKRGGVEFIRRIERSGGGIHIWPTPRSVAIARVLGCDVDELGKRIRKPYPRRRQRSGLERVEGGYRTEVPV
jgi:transcriptional regulator with XRE-family HTH domain